MIDETADSMPGLIEAIAIHPWLTGGQWFPIDLKPGAVGSAVSKALDAYPSLLARRGQILIALQEALGNVSRHSRQTTGGIGLCSRLTPDSPTMDFLVPDTGLGITVNGTPPPYGLRMTGHSYPFSHTLNGVVFCHVIEAEVLEFTVQDKRVDVANIATDDIPTNGMGMGIMARVMDRVTYLSHVGGWNLLWLQLLCGEDR
jgi:anti-sigma regulatory factor (Ser/Thr protein kinase)